MAEGTEPRVSEVLVGTAYASVFPEGDYAVLVVGHGDACIRRDEAKAAVDFLRAAADRLESWATPVLADGVSTKEASL